MEQIEETNKLIAEFMGVQNNWKYNPNEDWSELMPVVERIEDLGYFVEINKWVAVYYEIHKDRRIIYLQQNGSKIQMVYKAVVEFIQWYNKQK